MAGTSAKPQIATKRPLVDRRQIDSVRQFNRLYTRQLGLLDRGYLSSGWSLTEVRVLYELARTRSVTAAQIAQELQLDVAYLSRIIARFEKLRLLRRTVSRSDGRQRHLELTAKGRAVFGPLDRSAARQVSDILAPLAGSERERVVSAMGELERLLDRKPSAPAGYRLRSLVMGDIGWIVHRQALLYSQEYGWDLGYEALAAEILASFVRDFDPQRSGSWVAEGAAGVVGSVFLMPASAEVAKLRLLYVEPSARGMGLGRRLVVECVAGARARGYRTVTLWTNSVLIAARRIYETVGFTLCKEEHHHSFGKDLVGQTWELAL